MTCDLKSICSYLCIGICILPFIAGIIASVYRWILDYTDPYYVHVQPTGNGAVFLRLEKNYKQIEADNANKLKQAKLVGRAGHGFDYRDPNCEIICWDDNLTHSNLNESLLLSFYPTSEFEIYDIRYNPNAVASQNHSIMASSFLHKPHQCIIAPLLNENSTVWYGFVYYTVISYLDTKVESDRDYFASGFELIVDSFNCLDFGLTDGMVSQLNILSLGYGTGELTRRLYQILNENMFPHRGRNDSNAHMFTNANAAVVTDDLKIVIDGVEVDEMIIKAGKDWLCIDWDQTMPMMNKQDQITVFHYDAIKYVDYLYDCYTFHSEDTFIQRNCPPMYNMILTDVYDYDIAVQPMQYFYSVSFFSKIKHIWDKDFKKYPKILVSNIACDKRRVDQKQLVDNVKQHAIQAFGNNSNIIVSADRKVLHVTYYPV